MEKILNVAEYIFKEYYRVTGELIDEMKLQKLLYFSQRESLAILINLFLMKNLKVGNMDLFLGKLEQFLQKMV